MTKLLTPPAGYHWYNFNQNNSGGYFYVNKDQGIGQNVIILAENEARAEERFRELENKCDEEFSDYCECCGDRWTYDAELVEDEGDVYSYGKEPSFAHELDGSFYEVRV